jgi:hypothetical protein
LTSRSAAILLIFTPGIGRQNAPAAATSKCPRHDVPPEHGNLGSQLHRKKIKEIHQEEMEGEKPDLKKLREEKEM